MLVDPGYNYSIYTRWPHNIIVSAPVETNPDTFLSGHEPRAKLMKITFHSKKIFFYRLLTPLNSWIFRVQAAKRLNPLVLVPFLPPLLGVLAEP